MLLSNFFSPSFLLINYSVSQHRIICFEPFIPKILYTERKKWLKLSTFKEVLAKFDRLLKMYVSISKWLLICSVFFNFVCLKCGSRLIQSSLAVSLKAYNDSTSVCSHHS